MAVRISAHGDQNNDNVMETEDCYWTEERQNSTNARNSFHKPFSMQASAQQQRETIQMLTPPIEQAKQAMFRQTELKRSKARFDLNSSEESSCDPSFNNLQFYSADKDSQLVKSFL